MKKGIWIPDQIWKDTRLYWYERMTLALVLSFQRSGKTCYATNGWLAKEVTISKRTVSAAVTRLRDMGWLHWQVAEGIDRVLWIPQEKLDGLTIDEHIASAMPAFDEKNVHIGSVVHSKTSLGVAISAKATVEEKVDIVMSFDHDSLAENNMEVLQGPLPDKKRDKTRDKKTEQNSALRQLSRTDDIHNPFGDPIFIDIWLQWCRDRSERRLKAYTGKGERLLIGKLYQWSGGQVAVAQQIIDHSISQGYHGLFQPKNYGTNKGFVAAGFDQNAIAAYILGE